MPTYVVSSTLTILEWNGAQLLGPDLLAEVRRLKALPGGDLASMQAFSGGSIAAEYVPA